MKIKETFDNKVYIDFKVREIFRQCEVQQGRPSPLLLQLSGPRASQSSEESGELKIIYLLNITTKI